MFEQFDPQPQAADLHRVGVDVHPEEALLDEGLLLVEERFLQLLAFGTGAAIRPHTVLEQAAFLLVIHHQFIVLHGDALVAHPVAVAVREDTQFALDGDELVEGAHQEVAAAHGGVAYP